MMMEGGMMETLFNTNVIVVAVRLQRLRPQPMRIRLIGALRLLIGVCSCVCVLWRVHPYRPSSCCCCDRFRQPCDPRLWLRIGWQKVDGSIWPGRFFFHTTDSIWRAETQKECLLHLQDSEFSGGASLKSAVPLMSTWNWLPGCYGQFRIKIYDIKVENELIFKKNSTSISLC